MDLDLIVRNGNVVTASDIWYDCDIGIKVGGPLSRNKKNRDPRTEREHLSRMEA